MPRERRPQAPAHCAVLVALALLGLLPCTARAVDELDKPPRSDSSGCIADAWIQASSPWWGRLSSTPIRVSSPKKVVALTGFVTAGGRIEWNQPWCHGWTAYRFYITEWNDNRPWEPEQAVASTPVLPGPSCTPADGFSSGPYCCAAWFPERRGRITEDCVVLKPAPYAYRFWYLAVAAPSSDSPEFDIVGLANDGTAAYRIETIDCTNCEACCRDGLDDDADGLVDCDDADCSADASCQEVCGDGSDNDLDGLVDCADPDCIGRPGCVETCANGLDDDGDTLVDCEDPDCATDAACTTELTCDDLRDNDDDGAIDCDDDDCVASEHCTTPEEQPPAENAPGDDCLGDIGIPETCPPEEQGIDAPWPLSHSGPAVVLLHSGQEKLEFTDLYLKGKDPVTDIRLVRRHLTRVSQPGSPFGAAWALNYRQFLMDGADGDLVHEAFGRRDRLVNVAPGKWEGRNGRCDLTRRHAEDGTAELIMRGGTRLVFTEEQHAGRTVGRLTSVVSAWNNQITIEWQPSSEQPDPLLRRIMSIVDSYGRPITFHYLATNPQLVERIEDPDGRTVRYAYEGLDLTEATTPSVTSTGGVNDFPSGRTTRFRYRGDTGDAALNALIQHALTEVIYPREMAGTPGGPPRRPRG